MPSPAPSRGRVRPSPLSYAGATALRARLEPIALRLERTRVAFDPVEAPRRFAAPRDQEIAGLLAAALAYGRVQLFRPVLFRVLDELGPSPFDFVRSFDPKRDGPRFASFRYRFNLPADLGALFAGAGAVLAHSGSLGAFFADALHRTGSLQAALAALTSALRREGQARVGDSMGALRGLDHLLPDAAKGGACKRLLLYLRWMVRRDAVDLGAWEHLVPRRALLVPLDTHVMRMARHLGLTKRSDLSWRTAEEVTASLRRLDPDDPVRFDFTLCHFGMSGACPLRVDRENCRRCPLREVCRVGRKA